MILLMIIFFFNLSNGFFLLWIAVFVNMCVVFWKDAVDKKLFVFNDVLVILSKIG